MVNDAVELPLISFTVTSRANMPGEVGVPETLLPEAIRPGGVPDMDQVGDAQVVPLQVAENVQLYGIPTCPLGGEPEITGAAACALSGRAIPDRQSKAARAKINLTEMLYTCLSHFT